MCARHGHLLIAVNESLKRNPLKRLQTEAKDIGISEHRFRSGTMSLHEGKDEKGSIPMWDGKAESFAHFIVECKWSLPSSKASERPLLAARIVRKALQSPRHSLVQLMYRLRPEDFRTESDVGKLIKYLEESPLNKQPLPDAGAKIGNYYRRLVRKPNEPVNAFLIREEKTHDDMIRALQRLLREKELTFEDYDMDLNALKTFCGFQPGASLYFGPEDRSEHGDGPERSEASEGQAQAADEEGTQTPRSSQRGRPSQIVVQVLAAVLHPLGRLRHPRKKPP